MQKKKHVGIPKYLPKQFDPLMMEQDDVTPEELMVHFTGYAMDRGFDPSWLYKEHVRFQEESVARIAELVAEVDGVDFDIIAECRQAWAERERRLKMIAEVRSEILEGR